MRSTHRAAGVTAAVRRPAAAAALVVVVAAGLAVARGLASSPVTDIAGDALYAVAAYTGLVLLLPRAPRFALALAAAGWCVAVELLQLTGLPAALAERVPLVALLLGTGFDARDLVVYVFAVVAAAVLDRAVSARLLPGGRARADVGRPG
ncbi:MULTISPECIES: DUF2809 domain-containing protein [Microbacterium]|uniref:ribosomal maturation YjgA family protein n=1 Tax=Microbacterium TaxID=33882 RepID=UPI002786CC52|nr:MULTISPECIES: DUF2809 domain-containing protein [Microbacterium]MDQ1083596.1 hypothetical protein [Microbacterium sp. SORGH_AS_0344]MDQ1171128.1 hypothetical protein [Microbacterium proteolyticum]